MYIENQSKMSREELVDQVKNNAEKLGDDAVPVYTGICFHCWNHGSVFVRKSDYSSWVLKNLSLQEAFPEMPSERREQILNGIHPECWNELFPKEEV